VGQAREWLASRDPAEEVLVVAASAEASGDLLRASALASGAAFGWHRATLLRLAASLATPRLVAQGLAPVGRLAAEALTARLLHRLGERAELGRYASVSAGPGFARALTRSMAELRHADVASSRLPGELSELGAAFDRELRESGLLDRAAVLGLAREAALDPSTSHAWLGLPTLWLDVPVESEAERALVAALVARSPEVVATVAAGDSISLVNLEQALRVQARTLDAEDPAAPALQRLQTHLFEEAEPTPGDADDGVVMLSAPGESRECVEIARRVLAAAAAGVPFDEMAVLLRSAEEYRPHLEEAFARAQIPVCFVRGALRPDPSGRAFLALLRCGAEGLSARRFAEYLSLGELPRPDAAGSPPEPRAEGDRWVAPDGELVPEAVEAALQAAGDGDEAEADAEGDPVGAEGRAPPRAPRRWERLLVDASVIGGRDRWEHRLSGLAAELTLDLEAESDPESPRAHAIVRNLGALESLRAYALPLLGALEAFPKTACWGEWLDALSALATRALRRPDRVLSVIAELAPMAPVGGVGLEEILLVLEGRLTEVAPPPPRARYGRVFVGPAEAARGLVFDVVFVPGLAEKLFPRRIGEDPILLDGVRERLEASLVTNDERIAHERLALRLAVGAAARQVVLSYPRLDLDQGRPRVPSFYALEAMRAAEGKLPGFDELAKRAESIGDARVGWPAPREPRAAIDDAEHDLALLERLLRLEPERSVGTARYLLTANPHLGRALRFRARRWLRRWTPADGLVEATAGAREALDGHSLAARSYSATALQYYAACPYRFFLYSVHRLAPREVPEAIEELSPLQRGSLVHDVQFELLGRLRDAELLPVRPESLMAAREQLDATLDRVASRYHEELAPAIDRVWDDGVASIRADLREWLRRMSEDDSGFVPWRFELAFGLTRRRESDPHSVKEPLELDCGLRLRGSIDLVERGPESQLRVTDHKTGRVRFEEGGLVGGGEALQPVLYALAAERLFSDARVESGRLYYCTATGGYEERVVPLDGEARKAADLVTRTISDALGAAFFPAAPAGGACRYCDYRLVCGPYEELRTSRKPSGELAPLAALRELA
jgi:CRISPR/Cas system-associated exonuclease Cas4 (RecB family)